VRQMWLANGYARVGEVASPDPQSRST
jgi:hypothetical protein